MMASPGRGGNGGSSSSSSARVRVSVEEQGGISGSPVLNREASSVADVVSDRFTVPMSSLGLSMPRGGENGARGGSDFVINGSPRLAEQEDDDDYYDHLHEGERYMDTPSPKPPPRRRREADHPAYVDEPLPPLPQRPQPTPKPFVWPPLHLIALALALIFLILVYIIAGYSAVKHSESYNWPLVQVSPAQQDFPTPPLPKLLFPRCIPGSWLASSSARAPLFPFKPDHAAAILAPSTTIARESTVCHQRVALDFPLLQLRPKMQASSIPDQNCRLVQRHVLAIISMAPVHATCAFVCLAALIWYPLMTATPYFILVKDLCMVYVFASLFYFLVDAIGTEKTVVSLMEEMDQIEMPFPLGWTKPWSMGFELMFNVRYGINQMQIALPTLALLRFCANGFGISDGSLLDPIDITLCLLSLVSATVAMYCIIVFYRAVQAPLEETIRNSFQKILAVLAVVFVVYIQGVIVRIITCMIFLPTPWQLHYTVSVILGVELWLAVLEMVRRRLHLLEQKPAHVEMITDEISPSSLKKTLMPVSV